MSTAVDTAAPAPRDWRSRPLVNVRGTQFVGRDLIGAGVVSGRWPRLETELLSGLALLGEHEVARAERRQAERELRYARSLISADEFARWATAWGITLSDVRRAVERRILRERVASAGQTARPSRPSAATAELLAEAICSGTLEDCARWLVDRVLVDPGAYHPSDAPRVEALRQRERELLALAGIDDDDGAARRRLELFLRSDAAYDEHVARLCTVDAVAARLHRHRFDWLSFRLAGLACPTPGIAAEAALLLTEQGLPIADVARLAGLAPQHRQVELETSSPTLRARLVTARTGDVVGPLEESGAHWVWVVEHRRVPDPCDPQTVARARLAIVEDDMHQRRAGAVQWTPPEGAW